MTRLLCALLLVSLLGCQTEIEIDLGDGFPAPPPSMPVRPERDYPEHEREYPTVNLEHALRQANWIGSQGEGSCVHATMIMLFRWQGRERRTRRPEPSSSSHARFLIMSPDRS